MQKPNLHTSKAMEKPTKEENEILAATKSDLLSHQTIGIVKLPAKQAEKFERFDFSNCKNHHEISLLSATKEYKTLIDDTINYYEKFSDIKNSSIPHNIYLGEPNL